MSAMASQITSLTIVYSSLYSGADHRKHQSSASLAFVRRIHRSPVNSPHKWPVARKLFPFQWWRHHAPSVAPLTNLSFPSGSNLLFSIGVPVTWFGQQSAQKYKNWRVRCSWRHLKQCPHVFCWYPVLAGIWRERSSRVTPSNHDLKPHADEQVNGYSSSVCYSHQTRIPGPVVINPLGSELL